jgi:hypothetical protein
MVVLSIFSKNIIYQEFFENFYVCMHHGPVLFVNGIGDDGTTCVFSRGFTLDLQLWIKKSQPSDHHDSLPLMVLAVG